MRTNPTLVALARLSAAGRFSALVLLGVGGAGIARAETVNCTPISTLPVTITVADVYCLTTDLATGIASGSAVTIATNGVVLDLNGHKIGGLAAGPGTTATGISATQRQNITIRNGTVRGFRQGIALADTAGFTASQGHVVEHVRADQNTATGISVAGRGILVRNNQVVATGGSTLGPDQSAYGIAVAGPGNRVLYNDVITVVKQGAGTAVGVLLSGAPDSLAVGNRITEADEGITFLTGTGSAGKYRDTITSSVAVPFTGGTDAGNNN